MTDFWFPTPPGLIALPATPPITTNPNPAPPNTVAAPGGFDPLNPDLDNLFNVVLPVNVPPIYPATMEQTIALTIPAYNLAMTWESVLHLRAQAVLFDFGPSTESAPVVIRIKGSGEVIFSESITPVPTFRIRIRGDETTLTVATQITPDQTVRIRLVADATIISPPVNEFIVPIARRVIHGAIDGTAGWNLPLTTKIKQDAIIVLPSIGTVTVAPNPAFAEFGDLLTLVASRSGSASDITWGWVKPVGSSAPNSTTNTLAWSVASGDSGTYTATATSVESIDSPQSGSASVTAAALIGILSIATSHPGSVAVGDVITLTASYTGSAGDVTYAWIKPPASAAPSSTTNILTWTVTDQDSGNYTVTATSATAPDSPQTANITVNAILLAKWTTGVTGFTLANDDREATASTTTAEKWIVSATSKTAGKWYTEIRMDYKSISQSQDDSFYGVTKGLPITAITSSGGVTVASTRAPGDFADPSIGATTTFSTELWTNTVVQTLRIAVDLDAKKLWLGINTIWIGGGDPVAGTSPTSRAWTTTPAWQIGMRMPKQTTVATLPGTTSALIYSVPTGFNVWSQ